MPNIKDPLLVVSASLDEAKSKKQLQKQLDKVSKELSYKITGDTQKQVSDTNKITNAIKIQGKEREKNLQYEQRVRYGIEKQISKQLTAEKMVSAELDKQNAKLELYKQKFDVKASKLTAGQYGGRVDTASLSSLSQQVSTMSVDPNNIKASTLQMQQMDMQFKNIATNAQLASRGIKGFGEDLSRNLTKFGEWMVASTVFYGVARSIQYGITTIFELDKAVTELKKTTTATEAEIQKFVQSSYDMADALAATNIQVIEATGIFSKMGYTLDIASQLGQLAVKLQTVGDGMGTMEETANSLVAILKGFGVGEDSAIAESTKRIDQLNAVSNEFAVSTSDLTNGMQRASATMAMSNNTFEQTTALLTSGTEIMQRWEVVSRGLVTISQRIRGVSEDGGTLGLTLEDSFGQLGISLTNLDGSIKSTFDVLSELQAIYPTLTETQRQWIGGLVAGRDQIKVLSSIMQNWTTVSKSMDVQMNATGSATEELNRKLDSLEGRVNKMTNSFAKFWTSAIDSTAVKMAISGITGIVDIFTTLNVATQGALLPMSLLLLALAKFTNLNLASVIAQWIISMTSFESVVGSTTVSVNAFGLSLKSVYALMGVLGAVLIAGSAIYNQYQKDVQKTREETEKFKVAQEQLKETLSKNDNLSAKTVIELEDLSAKYEDATLKAKKLRAEILASGGKQGSSEYNKLQQDIKEIELRFKELGTTVKDVKSNIDFYNKSVADSKKQNDAVVESFDHLNNRLANSTSNYELLDDAQKEFKENGYLTQSTINAINEKYGKFIDVTKLSGQAIVDFINTNKKAITQGINDDIIKTNSAIEETKKRIDAMKLEMQAYALLTSMKADTAEGLQAEKMYMHGTSVGGSLSKLEAILGELESKRGMLKNSLKEMADVGKDDKKKDKSSKAKIDLLTDLEKQLLANAHATSILKSQQSLLEEDDPKRIDSLKQEIELYNKRQDLLHQQADATRKEISTIKSKKKLTDQDKKNIEELEANLKSYGEEWWNLENAIANVGVESEKTYDAIIKKQEEASKKNLESINNLKDSIKSMIEQEYKDKIELEKKSVENAKDELDLRLKQLETEKDLADFLAGKADKEKDINKINDKIISLQTASNQGDMRARAELIKLEEERAKTQIELDKYITDETFKNKKEALQNEYDIFEDASDDRVEGYEQELKEVGTIAKRINDELNAYLSGTNTSLYSELIAWNSKYGTGMDSDIISKWRAAIDLLIEYNKLQGGSPNVAGYERQTVIERMKMRGAQWASSSPERRAELNLANIEDAKSIGATYNPGTGQYIDASGAKIYDKGGLKPIGQVGVMAENVKEWVLKDNNIIDLAKIGVGQFLKTLSPTNIPLFNSSSQSAPNVNIVINGAVNDSNIQRINNNIKETILSVSQGQLDSFRSRGLKPATRTR